MALWTWWPGDPLPALTPIDHLEVSVVSDAATLAPLTALDTATVQARLDDGNQSYHAWLAAVPVAYGWVATASASIGELDVDFRLAADRYLWDFVTLPSWRGRGVYPHLLQAILEREGAAERRCWIINAPENVASARGIEKAGFQRAGDLAFTADRRPALLSASQPERARPGAALLGVPLLAPTTDQTVSPCWCCVMDALRQQTPATCWPAGVLPGTACTCGTRAA
jgi:GNAT superfamily N-acetyltransferase